MLTETDIHEAEHDAFAGIDRGDPEIGIFIGSYTTTKTRPSRAHDDILRNAVPDYVTAGLSLPPILAACKLAAEKAVRTEIEEDGLVAGEVGDGYEAAGPTRDVALEWEEDSRFQCVHILRRKAFEDWDWTIAAFVVVDCCYGPGEDNRDCGVNQVIT